MTTAFPPRLVAELMTDQREIVTRQLPDLAAAIWDLELAYGAGDEDLGRMRGDCDELQTDIAIHLGEEAEFLMPSIRRLEAGETLDTETLDRVHEVIAALRRRHDDFDGKISRLRERLLEAVLPAEAEEDRADLLDRLDALLARLRRHDREELDALFPAALAAVHDQLVVHDEAEDRAQGWT